ncbi:hypothetical protein ACQ7BN_08315 [Streptococcus suis]|uniref:hypothetical protein n=1 Tax=Streptococcus suis TaxID=1307 RepID=UPI003D369998|nr:hypothetical protein [Streptococcus suis]MCK3937235.1 hypothetical protein [Streptococcus suis]
MYQAVIPFVDADTKHEYKIGDEVDVAGKSKERITEMTTEKNRIGQVLIEKVKEEKEHGKNR